MFQQPGELYTSSTCCASKSETLRFISAIAEILPVVIIESNQQFEVWLRGDDVFVFKPSVHF